MVDDETVRAQLDGLNDRRLLAVVTEEAEQHTDRALAIARALCAERGLALPPRTEEPVEAKLSRARRLEDGTGARELAGAVVAVTALALTLALGGSLVFYGAFALGLSVMNDASTRRRRAAELRQQVERVRTRQRERASGLLSLAEADHGLLSFSAGRRERAPGPRGEAAPSGATRRLEVDRPAPPNEALPEQARCPPPAARREAQPRVEGARNRARISAPFRVRGPTAALGRRLDPGRRPW